MDFNLEHGNLISAYPHQMGDAEVASSTLMNNLSGSIQGSLIRVSPHAFIYSSMDGNHNDPCPVCHLVLSTPTHHLIGGMEIDPKDNSEVVPDDISSTMTTPETVMNTVEQPTNTVEQPTSDVAECSSSVMENPISEEPQQVVSEEPMVETVEAVMEHSGDMQMESMRLEGAIQRKYQGVISRQSPTSFTHVRPDGVVDHINTHNNMHIIRSHRFK